MNDQHQAFLNELQQLLREFDATLEVDDHWTGYSECGRDLRISVEFNSDYSTLDLGTYVNPESHGGKNG